MSDNGNFEDGRLLGEILSRLEGIGRDITEIKASMVRYGERTGELEEKRNSDLVAIKVLEAKMEPVRDDISDLKDTRKKVSWAIVGAYVTGMVARFWR